MLFQNPLEVVPVNYPYVDLIVKNVKQTRRSPKNKEGRVWDFSPRTAINILKHAMSDHIIILIFPIETGDTFLRGSDNASGDEGLV